MVEEQERRQLMENPKPPKPEPEPRSVHWAELAAATPGSRIATEWNFYRRQVERLLAEGHEGKWVLIKGEEIIGIWATRQEADQVGAERFLMQDVLIHQVLTREPILRGPLRFRLWHS